MDMESNGEFSDHSVVVKRKRTKRQRPSSSFCAATVTSSSSSGGAFGGGGGGGGGGSFNYFSIQSPSVSTDVSLTTEEEEDMANCLIMLARSHSPTELGKADHQNTDKLSSRRFTEMANATTAGGKTGHCVYECKTCNRTFPSFQALGGHRASHKKPKSSVPEEIEKKALSPPLIKDEEETKINKSIDNLPPLSLQIPGNSKAKVHECSICGAEFASGQALGGHMRRHRTTTTVTTPYSPPLMSSQIITNMDATDIVENRRSNMLLLDLNLPAPEDDHLDSKFQFASTSQHLVFSAPALVNCHY